MVVGDVEDILEQWLPSRWAEEWDNVGLLVGCRSWSVREPVAVLDVTEAVLEDAISAGSTFLLSHHPLLFSPLLRLDFSTPQASLTARALLAGISVFSVHTNWDAAPDGVNVCLAETLGLVETVPLQEGHDGSWGMGAFGLLSRSVGPEEFLDRLRRLWGLSWAHYYGTGKPIRSVALCGGAGADLFSLASARGADLFLTADVKYHQKEAILAQGLSLVVVDHGEMERVSLPFLARGLSSRLGIPVSFSDRRAVPAPLGAISLSSHS